MISLTLKIILFVPRERVFESPYIRGIFLLDRIINYVVWILTMTIIYTQYKEWQVMNYLIESQKHRKIEEILYQHYNEPINDPIKKVKKDQSFTME